MSKTNKVLIAGFVFSLIAVALQHMGLLVPIVHAQVPGDPAAGSLGDVLVALAEKLAMVNTFMHVLLLIALDFLGYFLQADFFNDDRMMSALLKIWVLSRDLMNLAFALMLIATAFYTIIVAKKDFVMSKLPTFVVAVILVNFSWFFPRVILDMANVVTATVYSVPSLLPGFTCVKVDESNPAGFSECEVIVDKMIFGTNAQQNQWQLDKCGAVGAPKCPCIAFVGCYKKVAYSAAPAAMSSAHAMINGLVTSFARVTELPQIPRAMAGPGPLGVGAGAGTSFQILMNIIMALVIQAAIVLPLLGLAIGLLIRIIVIWITTAFMPFVFLGYVVNGKLGTNVFGFEVDIWHEFINAAFLPAVVGIPMTIGFIMLSTTASIPAPTALFLETWNAPLLGSVRSWWALVWMFAAIVIIWTGSFKALAKSKIIGQFTEKIRGFGEAAFHGALQIPLLAPIPVPNGRGGTSTQTLGSLVHAPRDVSEALRIAASGRTGGRSFGQIFGDLRGGGGAGAAAAAGRVQALDAAKTTELTNAINALAAGTGNAADHRRVIEQHSGLSATNPIEQLRALQTIATNSGRGDIRVLTTNIERAMTRASAPPATPPATPPTI